MAIINDPGVSAVARAGIGLRLPHLAELVATRPAAGWLEVHPENVLANPHARELLTDLARDYRISLHTVGISIGSADGLDAVHRRRLRALADDVRPVLISGHLAWSSIDGTYLNDLLPLPYNEESLEVVARHLDEVQNALGRSYVVENPSTYVALTSSTMTESEFLGALVDRTGCGLLCDVSNIYLSAHNMRNDARAFIDQLPTGAVVEFHMGGFTEEDDAACPGSMLLVDTHAAPVAEGAWELYAYAIDRLGTQPTIVEWDSALPPLEILLEEAAKADRVRQGVTEAHHAHAS